MANSPRVTLVKVHQMHVLDQDTGWPNMFPFIKEGRGDCRGRFKTIKPNQHRLSLPNRKTQKMSFLEVRNSLSTRLRL